MTDLEEDRSSIGPFKTTEKWSYTMTFAQQLAKISLEIGAIKIDSRNPFTWASGYRMPLYNDNRLLLGHPDHRHLVAEAMKTIIDNEKIQPDVVGGVATAGIPHAVSLANLIQLPLIYVRSSPKEHGLNNQIEGILKPGQQVVVVEDLISTGGSALKAVDCIRKAGGRVDHCLAIFSYGFTEAEQQFQQSHCRLHTILNLESLLQCAEQEGRINSNEREVLDDWNQNPFEWGKKQGF